MLRREGNGCGWEFLHVGCLLMRDCYYCIHVCRSTPSVVVVVVVVVEGNRYG